MDVQHWKKVTAKKSQNGHKNGQAMSVVTWQWHKIIKSTSFCRELFSGKENIKLFNI
jgi:hypothetical protein